MAATDPKDPKHQTHDADHDKGAQTYERSDANIKAVFGVAVGVLIFAIVCAAIVQGMFWMFEKSGGETAKPKTQRQATEKPIRNDNEPPLQESPETDMIKYRAEENAKLSSYGWTDKGKGIARIPIEDAMKLTLQRGLPTSKAVPVFNAPTGTGHPSEPGVVLFDKEEILRHSGDSNSGRTLMSKGSKQ